MRFLRRSLIGIFLLAATIGLLAIAVNTVRGAVEARMNAEPRSFPQRERIFAVNVLSISPETLQPVLTAFGELRSRQTLDLRAPVGGTVIETSPALLDGGEVSAGEVLLRLDPATAQAARDRSQADLQDAEAELRDAERGLELARDELIAAESQADLRQQALVRARDLQDRGVGTAAAVETAELSFSSAEAAILSRRQSLAGAEARVDQATTRLSRAQINLAEAERTLEDTSVVAVFDGSLSDVSVALGGRLSPNERFATLLDARALEVAFRVSTSQYARLLDESGRLPALDVTITLDVAGVDLEARGVISREGAAVGDGQTGRLLFARLDDSPGFRPGDFVTVRIAEPALNGVASVPATAVGPDSTVLVVGEGDRLESRQTAILRRQGDDVIIRATDLAGSRIVAERSPLLGAGIAVRPIDPNQTAETASAEPETVTLDAARREKLVSFVNDSRMPAEAKTRIISQLEQDDVPAATVARLEARMGS